MVSSVKRFSLLSDDILTHLESIFFVVRNYLLMNQHQNEVVSVNPRGGNSHQYDIEAEKIVINYLLEHFPTSRILSEEVGMVNESVDSYDYIFVVDPVDGSINLSQGIPMVGFSIAVIEGESIGTDSVIYALIGNIFSGAFITASKGSGSFLRDVPVRRRELSLDTAIVSCSLNPLSHEHYLLFQSVNNAFKQVRSLGSSAIELSYVIQGITSAHYDFRRSLTAENFLAASLILKEMGGNLTDLYGNEISNIENLVEGYSIVASHNANYHKHFLDVLR